MDIIVPSIGESVHQGILSAWLKQEGDFVEENEDLFELETDKATITIPAPAAGVLRISLSAGSEVTVGQSAGFLDTEPSRSSKESDAIEAPSSEKTAVEALPEISGTSGEKSRSSLGLDPAQSFYDLSPAVRRIVAEHNLDSTEIKGSGRGGRITREDALNAARASVPESQAPRAAKPGLDQEAKPRTDPQRRVPMSAIRRAIAGRLLKARRQAAHLTTFNEIDMQRISDLRGAYRDEFEKSHGVRLGFMSFFVKACALALKRFENVNARIEGEEIVYNDFCNIGVAVTTDRGLIVPVLRDADRMKLSEIEAKIEHLARRAREKKITPDELSGGTFSITNGGIFGSLLSTPIPNYPETAILGMHAIQKRPVVIDDEILVRPMMYVALTYDHRLIDGRDAVSFLAAVKRYVEDPDRIFLDI